MIEYKVDSRRERGDTDGGEGDEDIPKNVIEGVEDGSWVLLFCDGAGSSAVEIWDIAKVAVLDDWDDHGEEDWEGDEEEEGKVQRVGVEDGPDHEERVEVGGAVGLADSEGLAGLPDSEGRDGHEEVDEVGDDGQEDEVGVEVSAELLEGQGVWVVVGLLGEGEFDVSYLVDGVDQKSDQFEDEEGDPVVLEVSRVSFQVAF